MISLQDFFKIIYIAILFSCNQKRPVSLDPHGINALIGLVSQGSTIGSIRPTLGIKLKESPQK